MSLGQPPRTRGRRLAGLGALGVALLLLATACAAEPVPGWQPPQAPQTVVGVTLLGEDAGGDAGDSAAATHDGGAAPADAGAEGAGEPGIDPATVPDAQALGLVNGRIRNDALPLAARYVYIPGVPAFNERVDRLLWSAISATGRAYSPQVHGVDAGLANRGCLAGSTAWPAADVLSRPETGPAGGAGTAITCEVAGAFGTTLVMVLRTVTGSAAGVTGDETQTWYVDLATGGVTADIPEWRDTAPAELWKAAVELLRQRVGALSTAPLADPDEAQLALAASALAAAKHPQGGGLVVSLAPGIASPELAGLGIEATADPLDLAVTSEVAWAWSSDQRRALLTGVEQPFAGVAAGGGGVPVNCDLVPCIAVTYDDGPSNYTPQLLDTLAAHGAKATFYMLGGYALGATDLVYRVAAEGHELGSHTMNHRDLTSIAPAEARAQVHDAATILRNISGQTVATYRPPYGAINAAAQAAIDMPAILWTIDTNDWRGPGVDALYERSVPAAVPGYIILFHDTHADTVNAAGGIFQGLHDRGFTLVTVSELFGGSVPNAVVRAR